MSQTLNAAAIQKLITDALNEDIGAGDVTTISCVPEDATSKARFIAKQPGVICGLDVAARVFHALDHRLRFKPYKKDGDRVAAGDIVAEIDGASRSILTGERTALNLLQHLSGIATRTNDAVEKVKDTRTEIVDTRKTTPGLRMLEKYAVRCGGGKNHRYGLSDGVLIKDNHISAAGGIKKAVDAVRKTAPHTLKIEVETENIKQIDEALDAGADIIMLDNMTLDQMTEAVRHIAGRALTEASGNMGDKDLAQVAGTGVDFISIGALTHSVTALDISLKFK